MAKVWAIADLHLSFGLFGKSMDVFGERWENHVEKLYEGWISCVGEEDLVLVPGDISWAMQLEEVKPDLEWMAELPGTKLLLRGNHDYWWSSLSKISQVLPPSVHIIQNNAFYWNEVAIGGARLWDSWEYRFGNYIQASEMPIEGVNLVEDHSSPEQREKIFLRELERLRLSLRAMTKKAKKRIAMTHYPPIGVDLKASRASELFEEYEVAQVVFGHLHNVVHDHDPLFGVRNGVHYQLVAADYLNFRPLLICS